MSSFLKSVNFVDLVRKEVNSYKDNIKLIEDKLKENNGIEKMIEKYLNFINNLSLNIINNIDKEIELIWKIHLLYPNIYRKDYYKYFGRIITPNNYVKITNV